jgi:hypothetical protein
VHVEELVRQLISGRIAMDITSTAKGGPESDLLRSISYFTSRSLRIKQVGDFIGLVDWPDERFQA